MNLNEWTKPLQLVAAAENAAIDRWMLIWANNFPRKPVETINYEFLPADSPGMALSTIQSAYITRRYILGGYQAEYQFKIIYRVKTAPGKEGNPARLKAEELLNEFGDWASAQFPDIGYGLRVLKLEAVTRASLFARYETNDEDHQILMKMTYERMV